MTGNPVSVRQLESIFGPLEIRVLEALWARERPACVRDLQPRFPGVAYTTLMTTLDRLFRKGTLVRNKNGRAFFYRPKLSQQELISELAGSAFATLLPGDSSTVRPILSMFVDTVGRHDHALLDELERLVRARRDELKRGEPK
jgi:predicted transcriptional regulator